MNGNDALDAKIQIFEVLPQDGKMDEDVKERAAVGGSVFISVKNTFLGNRDIQEISKFHTNIPITYRDHENLRKDI